MPVEKAYSLDGVPLLASLDGAERDALLRKCRVRTFADGEHVIDIDDRSREVHFVVSGVVRIVNFSLSGREVALDDIGPGGYFGELAAIDGGPRSAYVMAHGGPAATAALPCTAFLDLLTGKPQVGLEIMRRLAKMVRQDTDRIMGLSTLGANNRVYAELLRQAWLFSGDGRTAAIAPIPLHSDIASRVGTTRETVSRALNGLARQGLVERRRDTLFVADMVALAKMIDDLPGGRGTGL